MAFRQFSRTWRTSECRSDETHSSSFKNYISKWRAVKRPDASLSESDIAQAPSSQTSKDVSQDSPVNDQYFSQDESSSTDAGDSDASPISLGFSDMASSDSEAGDDSKTESPLPADNIASACVYSVKILLRLRGSPCAENIGAVPVRYATRSISELPSPADSPKPRPAAKGRTTSQPFERPAFERQALPESAADSWRQALPESAADSWVAQQRKRDASGSADDDASVLRAARSILNKLTVEKFDSLFEQLTTCGIQRPHHISLLMREVFEKATTQHHFIPMYAELCVQLEKDPRIAAVVEGAGELYNFRRLLLNQCQQVFEQLLESRSVDAATDEESALRRKQQALGNMKLIGHLLVHGMLSSDLFVVCCEELVCKRAACPEALESLVALMMVAGPKFDVSGWQYYDRLDKILQDMRRLTKDKSVVPRSRFLIRDVLDARESGWPSSPAGSKPSGRGPAKLDEALHIASSAPPVAAQAVSPEAQRSGAPADAGSTKARKQQLLATTEDESARRLGRGTCGAEQCGTAGKTPAPVAAVEAFDVIVFRRSLNAVFSELASEKNIPAAVQRIREQQVPAAFQADQFVDILTRVVEERRGAVRRCELAFLAGLGAAENSAFQRKECLAGVGKFFNDVYEELCNEVHRLQPIMKSEFMPAMLSVFPAAELNKVVLPGMRK